jgi:hypothetical protein
LNKTQGFQRYVPALYHPENSDPCLDQANRQTTAEYFYSQLYSPNPMDELALGQLLIHHLENLRLMEDQRDALFIRYRKRTTEQSIAVLRSNDTSTLTKDIDDLLPIVQQLCQTLYPVDSVEDIEMKEYLSSLNHLPQLCNEDSDILSSRQQVWKRKLLIWAPM